MTKVSVIIPARNSQHTIMKTIESLLNQTYQPYEILIVIGPEDKTFEGAPIPECVKIIETKPPKDLIRDAQWKRLHGAFRAAGEVIFFTDSKAIAEEHAIENAIRYIQEGNVSVVAGISPGWPDEQEGFIALVHEKALVMNLPEFPKTAFLNAGNFGKTESLPVTTALAMRKEVFQDIRDDFAVEFSRFASTYDDYLLSWLIVKCGYQILLTNEVVCYHKHRLQWAEYRRQISRSGQSAAVMLRMYPDCPFGQRRRLQVVSIFSSVIVGTIITTIVGLSHASIIPILVFGGIGYSILGILNLIKARDVRGFVIPIFTIALVLTFSIHFAKEMRRREERSFDPSYLQIH